MTKGGKRQGAGRKPKPTEQRRRQRMISLSPELDDRLIDWSIRTGNEISPLIQKLLIEYFEK